MAEIKLTEPSIQDELDLMVADEKKTLKDEQTGVTICKYNGSYVARGGYLSGHIDKTFYGEIFTFKGFGAKEPVHIDDKPSVFIGDWGHSIDTIRLMIQVGRLAKESHEDLLYKQEKLLVYALDNIPGNHPIFKRLDSKR